MTVNCLQFHIDALLMRCYENAVKLRSDELLHFQTSWRNIIKLLLPGFNFLLLPEAIKSTVSITLDDSAKLYVLNNLHLYVFIIYYLVCLKTVKIIFFKLHPEVHLLNFRPVFIYIIDRSTTFVLMDKTEVINRFVAELQIQ